MQSLIKAISKSAVYLVASTLLSVASASSLCAAEIRNLKTGQQENRAFAVYDLYGKPGERVADVKVVLEIGGERYSGEKLTLSGDFGKAVKIGTRKTIYWDVLKDMPTGFEGDLFWNVETVTTGTQISSGLSAPVDDSGRKEFTDPAAMIDLVYVPSGCFKMGDAGGGGDSDEGPSHEVCLDGFYIGKYEITQFQWQTVMGSNPSFFKKCGQKCPVENISWADANRFIKKLNSLSGKTYRLPTEAEWEYAARSGGKAQRFSGSDDKIATVAWYELNADGASHPVGEKLPNDAGVYDMSGNIAEWVQDWKGDYPSVAEKNPSGKSTGKFRVIRGGSWLDEPNSLRTTYRSELNSRARTNLVGMRVVLPSP